MPCMSALVTEDELNRAQQDPEFRQKLMMDKLDLLLGEIARLRETKPAPDSDVARQIREGVDLAVKLADLLQKTTESGNPRAA